MTWRCQATILRWVDGDTAVADLDLGWGIWRREVKGAPSRLRLLGCNAPELSTPEGQPARDIIIALVPILLREQLFRAYRWHHGARRHGEDQPWQSM